jgi:hypothetical protein
MKAHGSLVSPALLLLVILLSVTLCSCGSGVGGGSADPSFSLTASPSTLRVPPGGTNTDLITVQTGNGFSGQVAVTISNLPSGVTVTPNPLQVSLSGTSVSQLLTIAATLSVKIENVSLAVNATSGSESASANVELNLQAIAVTTWHYDNARTGVNPNEPVLTLANVNSSSFGELYTFPVDGAVVGGTLYLGDVSIPGKGVHNVIYAATMHDSVYAYDADSDSGHNATPLWQTSLLPAGATSVPMTVQGCQTVTQWTEVGVLATPVIDPSTGTIYVVAKTYENQESVFRLHALDVTTGQEKMGGPVKIAATYTLGGQTDTFSAYAETNRPALLLTNGHVYLAFGSNGCNDFGDDGWVLSYNAATLAQEGAFDDEPGKALAAIWGKGGGLSSDSSSNIYAETGEGYFVPGTNFGSSIFKLSQSGAELQLADWFTPYNQAYLNSHDLDLNDSVLVLPDQAGAHPHLAVGVGKEGTLYLLDRDNMGHYCSTCTVGDAQIVQELLFAAGQSTGSLLYWNSTVYSTGVGSPIMEWSLNNGLLSTTPVVQSAVVVGEHSPVITANGNANGILWQINGSELSAFDALKLNLLYSTNQTQGRDTMPPLPHFAQLLAANGKVYVGANSGIVVFGLLQ